MGRAVSANPREPAELVGRGRRGLQRAVRTALLVSLALSPASFAQGSEDPDTRSLRQHFGRESLAIALESTADTRRGALRSIAQRRDLKTLRSLTRFLKSQPELAADEWSLAVRALGAHADEDIAQPWLFRILTGAASKPAAPRKSAAAAPSVNPADQSRAALYLAKEGSAASLKLLGQALRRDGRPSRFAAAALRAHPPQQLGPLLNVSGPATIELVSLLGKLNDQRAFLPLRAFVRGGNAELQAAAALALLGLGELEVVTWAKHRAQQHGGHLELLSAAVEILLHTRQPEARAGLLALSAQNLERAIALLERYPHGTPVEAAIEWAPKLAAAERERLFFILGQNASAAALEYLAAELDGAERHAAAHALSTSPGSLAERVLERLSRAPKTELDACRARVVREFLRVESSQALSAKLEQFLQSSSKTKRALGAWGLAVRKPEVAIRLLKHKDPVIAAAAASSAFVQLGRDPDEAGEFFVTAAKLLRSSALPPPAWLSVALMHTEARDRIPSSILSSWVNSGSAAQFAAARVLASRQDQKHAPLVAKLLDSPNARLKASSLYGLGDRTAPKELHRLVDAYHFESDPSLRAAALSALGASGMGSAIRRLLAHARDFDPSEQVRRVAKQQQLTPRVSPSGLGHEAVWVSVSGQRRAALATVFAAGGLTTAFAIPPDGVLVVLGSGPANLDVRLAGGAPGPVKPVSSPSKEMKRERQKSIPEASEVP